jgi:hypothetical protein
MKLDAVVRNQDALLEMERYADGGARSYDPLASRTEAAPRYQPEIGTTSFGLAVNAPNNRVALFKADPPSAESASWRLDCRRTA